MNQPKNTTTEGQISPPMCVQHAQGFSKEIWEGKLGLPTSYKFVQMWSGVFSAYDQCRHLNKQGKSAQRLIVAMATGMGKTQTAIYYAAKLDKEVGMLIVTPFISEANSLASQINDLSEENRAIAYHSESDIYRETNELKHHQVVIVTHKMFTSAVDSHTSSRQLINDLYAYGNDKRSVVVIDEAINTIKSDHLSYEAVHELLTSLEGHLKHKDLDIDLKQDIKNEVLLLERLSEVFKKADVLLGGKSKVRCLMSDLMGSINIKDYQLPITTQLVNQKRLSRVSDTNTRYSDTINDINSLLGASWSYYAKKNEAHGSVTSFHTARSAIPEDMSVVVLDATSNVDHYYDIYPNVTKVPLPKNVRSYKNVDLYVAKDQKTGQDALCGKDIKGAVNSILDHVPVEFEESKLLIFTFNKLEKALKKTLNQEAFSDRVDIDHFGNLNGKNNYKEHTMLYIFGTFFKPDSVFTDIQALSTRGNVDCFNNTDEVIEERKLLKNSNISAELIQAINRISCRSIVDSDGNCQKCSIYLQLPVDKVLAELIMESIQKEMPGINVHDWHFDLIKSKKSGRKSTYENEFVAALKSIPVGESKLHVLLDNLPFKKGIKDKIKKRIADNDADDSLIKAMKGEQVTCTKDKNKWIISKKNI